MHFRRSPSHPPTTPRSGGIQNPAAAANTSATTAQFWSMSRQITTPTSGVTTEAPTPAFSFAEHTESPRETKSDDTEPTTPRIPTPEFNLLRQAGLTHTVSLRPGTTPLYCDQHLVVPILPVPGYLSQDAYLLLDLFTNQLYLCREPHPLLNLRAPEHQCPLRDRIQRPDSSRED